MTRPRDARPRVHARTRQRNLHHWLELIEVPAYVVALLALGLIAMRLTQGLT